MQLHAELRANSHAEAAAGKEEGGPAGAQPTRRPRGLPEPRLELRLRSAPVWVKGAGRQGVGRRPPTACQTSAPSTSSYRGLQVGDLSPRKRRGRHHWPRSATWWPPAAHWAHPGAQRLCGLGAGLQPQVTWVVFENSAPNAQDRAASQNPDPSVSRGL